ncbi:2-oxoacid ferredoxin oxidoreductase [compost metagenome]
MIAEFEETFEGLLAHLAPANVGQATEIVRLWLEIRGYGPVKEQAAAQVRAEIRRKLAAYGAARAEAA